MATDKDRVLEIGAKYEALAPVLDERRRRLWVAAEARSLGRGGIATVTAATGIRAKRIRAPDARRGSGGARIGSVQGRR